MPKLVPIVLWIVALSALVVFLYLRNSGQSDPFAAGTNAVPVASGDPPGAVLVDLPWKHFPDVPRFDLKDQNGEVFDSAKLDGKPYLVSFFFASCPGICRDLNKQIARLNDQLRNEDVSFVSLSVDPENDTPQILNRYAKDFDAVPDRWVMLTDQKYKMKQLGEQVFGVDIDPATHSDSILLVDKWGRYRDRFKWDDPYDMKRLVTVVKDVAAEQELPLEKSFHTRNVLAGTKPASVHKINWVREFHLTDSEGKDFFSRDLTGKVWVGNFFFTSCPGICKQQNAYLRSLRERLGSTAPSFVSITTDPTYDTAAVLKKFKTSLNGDNNWKFLTGDDLLIRRIGSEFFHAHAGSDHHSSRLFVVDRWHRVRGNFDWQNPADEIEMLKLIEELQVESEPSLLDDANHSAIPADVGDEEDNDDAQQEAATETKAELS